MEKLSMIQDFRKLEKELGKAPSDILLNILNSREEMLFEQLATQENFRELKKELHADIQRIEFEMNRMRSDMEVRFATKEDLHMAISAIRTDVANLAWKMGALFTVQIGIVVAIMKLL